MVRTGLIYTVGKAIAPSLSRFSKHPRVHKMLNMAEEYMAVIQGRGAGTGWDLQSEVTAAVPFIENSDSVVFDVGANVGTWSQLLLETIDHKPELHLFEPLSTCQKIIQSLDLPNATLNHAAVGKEKDTMTLYSPNMSSLASLYKRRDFSLGDEELLEEEVEVITLDDYATEQNIQSIDFVKIDVEGHELSVLQGARDLLKAGKIKALLFEFGSPHINSRTFFLDFWDLFNSYGYQLSLICPGNVLRPIVQYQAELEHFRSTSNYVAVHNP